jgi:hypothetical protein
MWRVASPSSSAPADTPSVRNRSTGSRSATEFRSTWRAQTEFGHEEGCVGGGSAKSSGFLLLSMGVDLIPKPVLPMNAAASVYKNGQAVCLGGGVRRGEAMALLGRKSLVGNWFHMDAKLHGGAERLSLFDQNDSSFAANRSLVTARRPRLPQTIPRLPQTRNRLAHPIPPFSHPIPRLRHPIPRLRQPIPWAPRPIPRLGPCGPRASQAIPREGRPIPQPRRARACFGPSFPRPRRPLPLLAFRGMPDAGAL